jgi:hypothetical protein
MAELAEIREERDHLMNQRLHDLEDEVRYLTTMVETGTAEIRHEVCEVKTGT